MAIAGKSTTVSAKQTIREKLWERLNLRARYGSKPKAKQEPVCRKCDHVIKTHRAWFCRLMVVRKTTYYRQFACICGKESVRTCPRNCPLRK